MVAFLPGIIVLLVTKSVRQLYNVLVLKSLVSLRFYFYE